MKAYTAITTGAGTLPDWYRTVGDTGETYNVGSGIFITPTTYTITTSTLPAWLTFDGVDKFTVSGSVDTLAPVVGN